MKILLILFLMLLPMSGQAAIVYTRGQWLYVSETASYSVDDHYNKGVSAYVEEDWTEAQRQLVIVTENFSSDSFPSDAYFFLGISQYELGDYELANDSLDTYLELDVNSHYLTDAIAFKFAIAEAFREGARTRLFGYRPCPKWVSGYDLALTIYDEVILALPSSDYAAQSLFCKGALLCQMGDFRCSIESFQTLLRRFPRHELAPEGFLAINQSYLGQSRREFQNPDILVLAQLNFDRFTEEYPNHELVDEAAGVLKAMKEIYAWGLYNTGTFFVRTCHPEAAALYFITTISEFPETDVSSRCRQALRDISQQHPCLYIPEGFI